ncbi:hypothetical protein A3715_17325, partial [Oleiphilus sp. HI0009]
LSFPIIFYFIRMYSKHGINIRKAKNNLAKLKSIQHKGALFAYLRKIDPYVFEEMVLTAFQKSGYKIKRNKRYSGDGGIDGTVYLKGKKYLIQSKRYSSYISLAHLKEFQLLCRQHRCKGFFVHTGRTGKGCFNALSESNNISIVSGNDLISLLLDFNSPYVH